MKKQLRSVLVQSIAPAILFSTALQLHATPVTDDCVAGTGCILRPDGTRGVFEIFATYDIDTKTFQGSFTYTDPDYSFTSNQLWDYADPDGAGGYRILSFYLNDANYPNYNEIRIKVEDFGSSVDDTFEIQMQGTPYQSFSGTLVAECGGGIAISQDCHGTPDGGSTTGGSTGTTTSGGSGTTGGTPGGTTGGTPSPERPCDDFVTGGGWIITADGAKANFGVRGGIKNGFWGGLNYLDHGTRMHVKSTGVTGYTHISDVGRQITYNVNIDGAPGTAVVKVHDNGEPGRNDTFEITLSNGYTASGDLGGAKPGGGNLQLHKSRCGGEPKKESVKAKQEEAPKKAAPAKPASAPKRTPSKSRPS